MKKRFQDIIDNDAVQKSKHEAVMNSKVSERYASIYGGLFPKTRNYIVLDGSYEDENGDQARLPYIKYVFKT